VGEGVAPDIYFGWNPNIFVSKEHMQNIGTPYDYPGEREEEEKQTPLILDT
jgi:hypothetical protein